MRCRTVVGVLGLMFLTGCSGVWTPDPETLKSPEATARCFLDLVNEGRAQDAEKLVTYGKTMKPEFLEYCHERLAEIADKARAGRWHMEFVEIRAEGAGAVAVVNEDIKDGRPSYEPDPLYLVRVRGQWGIVPDLSRHEFAADLVSPGRYAVFSSLDMWFRERKEALMEAHAGGG